MDIFEIAGEKILPGESKRLNLPVAKLYTNTNVFIPVSISRGPKTGPVMFVCAAIHGDEINGIEIIQRLISKHAKRLLRGTLILVPMVNVYGVLDQSRYLPDRRDLNRSFPGLREGSLSARMAYLFMNEIVNKCDYGIDIHTGSMHRTNLPQIRANLDDKKTQRLAEIFHAPVLINAPPRPGSLREAGNIAGVKVLLYEAGEALRMDELSISVGVRGVTNLMRHLGMLKKSAKKIKSIPFIARSSIWIRSSHSGFVHTKKKLGDHVFEGDVLAEIRNPYGDVISKICTKSEAVIIGKQNIPMVQEGDALFHIAFFKEQDQAAEQVQTIQKTIEMAEKIDDDVNLNL